MILLPYCPSLVSGAGTVGFASVCPVFRRCATGRRHSPRLRGGGEGMDGIRHPGPGRRDGPPAVLLTAGERLGWVFRDRNRYGRIFREPAPAPPAPTSPPVPPPSKRALWALSALAIGGLLLAVITPAFLVLVAPAGVGLAAWWLKAKH